MSAFTDMLKADAAAIFTDGTYGFAESLTFRKADGTQFTRSAQVFRFTVADADGQFYQRMRIGLVNDADTGIAASEFDGHGWQVLASYRGETAQWRTLMRPEDGSEDHDSAWGWFETR